MVKHPEKTENSQYDRLVAEMYEKYGDGIHLPPEYANIIQNSTINLLIRLARYKFVARMIQKTDTVLEIGCGTGLGSLFMAQNCRAVHGIDLCRVDIEHARNICKRNNVRFDTVDFFDFSTKARFDAVVSLDVIEHMDKRGGGRFVKRSLDLIRPDGILIIGTPSVHIRKHQNEFSKAAHKKMYEQAELEEMVRKCYRRTLCFSMNDEVVHTGNPKAAWYYFVIGLMAR